MKLWLLRAGDVSQALVFADNEDAALDQAKRSGGPIWNDGTVSARVVAELDDGCAPYGEEHRPVFSDIIRFVD